MSFFANKNELRIVQTIYNVSDLNAATRNGLLTLVKNIEPNANLYYRELLLKNFETGEYVTVPSRQFAVQYGKTKTFPENEWQLITSYTKYARPKRLSQKWAAYVLPEKPKLGERLFIEDIIEDILADRFWYKTIIAQSGEAVWNGADLEIDMEPIKRFHLIG